MMKTLKSLLYVLRNLHRVEGLLADIERGIKETKTQLQACNLRLEGEEYREVSYGLEDVAL